MTGSPTPTQRTQAPETPGLIVPREVVETALTSVGAFFEPISGVDRHVTVKDFLDPSRAFSRAEILRRYTHLRHKKLLEVGSGFGTNLAVWIKEYEVDGFGVEPGGEGFDQGFRASQILLAANGIDPHRIVNAGGESLPFPDESFDIVYSANVLEHTQDPERVLHEAVRVLRKGGVLHMEMPNFLSYFEGHYFVLQPPVFWKPVLPFWIRYVVRKDPFFARTLQTQINPVWCRRMVKKMNRVYPLELISLGEEVFLDRLSTLFAFQTRTVTSRLGTLLPALQRINWHNWIGRAMIATRGFYPIYLTLRKAA